MTFDEILEQVIVLLQRQKRVAYGALKRRFDLDDAYLLRYQYAVDVFALIAAGQLQIVYLT